MEQFIRVTVKNSEEEVTLKKMFEDQKARVTKGFNSLIISPRTENIKKGDNKYLQLLKALTILQKAGFKNSAKIIKF